MSVSLLKKLMVAALAAVLVTPAVAASAATPPAKKITITQGKKIYDKAVKATNAWLAKNPHTITVRNEDKSYPDQPVDTRLITIDRDANIFLIEDGVENYIIGETLYLENVEGELAGYEIEIAEDLGLNVDAKYAIINPRLLDIDYPFEELRSMYHKVDDIGFTGDREGAKTTAVTYLKSGSTEFLTVTLQFPAKNGSPSAKRVLSTRIERGIITSSTDTNTSKGESYKVTTTYKLFTGTVSAPAGPYLEWDKVYLDPRYQKATDLQIASLTLISYVREAQALAAFEAIDKLTIEIWKIVAEDANNMVVYDKGVEFSYSDGKRACGVFTDEGADLELSTCTELGFTKL